VQQLPALRQLAQRDPLYSLTPDDKKLLWAHRNLAALPLQPGELSMLIPKVLLSCPQDDYHAVHQMHRLLESWPLLTPQAALQVNPSLLLLYIIFQRIYWFPIGVGFVVC
jgi:hypothetical protein